MESSVYLTDKMLESVPFSEELNLLELGAGTGSITRTLLSRMSTGSRLTAFEINQMLYDNFNGWNDRRLRLVNDSAADLHKYAGNESVDFIISGLPLANIPMNEKLAILEASYRALKPGGMFIQFQYSLNDFGLLKRKFSHVNCNFTLRNLPPAFIYHARK